MEFLGSHTTTVLLLAGFIILAFLHTARIRRQRRAIECLSAGLERAAAQFDFYAELHRAKGTEDGFLKAQTNAEYAYEARRLIDRWGC